MDVTEPQIRETLQLLRERSTGYRVCFGDGAASSVVLEDLGRFCRADTPTFHADPRQHARLEGRREVWLRIQQHLKKTPEQLLELFSGDAIRVVKVEDETDA